MSTLKVNTIQNASGVEKYLCQAWVNFNGTGTVAIRASGNVTSITDHSTGDFTVNFTNAMTDANYAAVIHSSDDANNYGGPGEITSRLAGSLRIETKYSANWAKYDMPECHVVIFR